ncbi:sulfatase [Halobiforma lacisalsi AJ5]|uniref:Sulfatase n=1 Tax=Natronobacterium lacisalsi AJ5 TaxID=358396 RepID=M0LB51_NATLA|nr:sulfatase [Halobiforma lacisalsi]APW97912.1 sulfatase [Halobiforma lacisalsi AJ5]EMA29180.1 sulfatase [Halobiforma lacisalsi AJ5]
MSDLPNVLLVILDSARAKNMGVYGYDRETTPFLDGFAEAATLYQQARSPSIHSIASHVSMFTGYHVEEHRAIHHDSQIDLEETIWRELSGDHDYSTGLFTPNRIISHASNLAEAFEFTEIADVQTSHKRRKKLFQDAYGPRDTKAHLSVFGNFQRSLKNDQPLRSLCNCGWEGFRKLETKVKRIDDNKTISGDRFIERFLEWEKDQSGQWAACLNLMDTHSPYLPDPQYNRWGDKSTLKMQNGKTIPSGDLLTGVRSWDELRALEALYDGSIFQVDQQLKTLFNQLSEDGELENTLVIVTSDHGEGFGERSRLTPEIKIPGHNWGIHEVLTHVPLIVKYPGQKDGKSVSETASLTNIPDVIRAVLSSSSEKDQFTKDDLVLSSTYRMLDRNTNKFPTIDNINNFTGPWRAVYENNKNGVKKYAQHKGQSVTVSIESPFEQEVVEEHTPRPVNEIYDALHPAGIGEDNDSVGLTDELEDHLKDLGYIR